MVCCQKLKLLLWKNWILRKRHGVMFVCEFAFPLYFFGLLLGTKIIVNLEGNKNNKTSLEGKRGGYPRVGDGRQSNDYPFLSDTLYSEKMLIDHIEDRIHPEVFSNVIGISPESSAVKEIIIPKVKRSLEGMGNSSKLEVKSFKNEKAMEQFFQECQKKKFFKTRTNFLFGIHLEEGLSGDGIGSTVSYKIRPNWDKLHTNELYNTNALNSSNFEPSKDLRESGVLGAQLLIDKILIQEMANAEKDTFWNTTISLKAFPRPKIETDGGSVSSLEQRTPREDMTGSLLLVVQIVVCGISMIGTLVSELVSEKETGTKELMKMAGLPEWIHWLGWFIINFLMTLFMSTLITLSICVHPSFIPHMDGSLFWVVLLLNGIWNITYSFLVASVFTKPSIAAAFGILYFLICFGGLAAGLLFYLKHYSKNAKLLLCFFPNVALQLAMTSLVLGKEEGATWESFHKSASSTNNPPILEVLLMMMATSILNMLICMYLEAILPKKFGLRKSPFFIFKPREWRECFNLKTRSVAPSEALGNAEEESKEDQDQPGFEADPKELCAGVKIINLRKVFGYGKNKKVVVDNLNMNMYEGQIFCLLGENGAGKTTAMSILTGLMSPTSGTAEIYGIDINTGMEEIRKTLGLCPQHNMLFDGLTPLEHLKFFGVLKGLTFSQAGMDGKLLLQVLKMEEKAGILPPKLSGGQKRRLSLGCALIGNPKVLFLDEPTSGMDPETRRTIWDILQTFRFGKTIILSTHHMEEADVLGDRIGIMSAGKLQCCGTASFLKKYYGAGFCLNMILREGALPEKILKTVQKHVEGAYFKESQSTSLKAFSISLPTDTSKLAALFKELLSSQGQLNIDEIGLSLTTLEDVFIKVEELNNPPSPDEEDEQSEPLPQTAAEQPKEVVKNDSKLQSKTELKQEASTNEKNPSENAEQAPETVLEVQPSQPIQTKRSCLSMRQCWGLLLKNLTIIHRNRFYIISQALIPILLTIGVVIAGSKFLDLPEDVPDEKLPEQRSLQLNLSDYKNPATYYTSSFTPNDAIVDIAAAYEKVLGDLMSQKANLTGNNGSFEEYLWDLGESKRYVVAAEVNYLGTETYLTAWHSNVAVHSAPLSINLLSNALLQARTNDSSSIKTSIHPFADAEPSPDLARILLYPTKETYEKNSTIFAAIIATLWTMVLALFVTNFVLEPTHEKVSNGKLLQFMTGVNPVQYWSSYFITNFLYTFFVILVIITMVFTFEAYETFTKQGGVWALLLIFTLYATASIPFAYYFSTSAKSSEDVFKELLGAHVFTGTFFALLSYLFQYVLKIPKPAAYLWPIHVIGKLFPGFCLIRALVAYGFAAFRNLECFVIPQRYRDIVCHEHFDLSTTSVYGNETLTDKLWRCCKNRCKKEFENSQSNNASNETFFCVKEHPYFEWTEDTRLGYTTVPGSIVDLCVLAGLCLVYFVVLMLIDYGVFMKTSEVCRSEPYPIISVTDEDVVMEADRVRLLVNSGLISEDALLVSLLSKSFKEFWAVTGLSFGVHYGECFGLLGVNGAGKTTAFKMLVGDIQKSFGEAYMGSLCLSKSAKQFLKRVGYCPQFDGIIEVLSGKEMLCLYARLRGLKGKELQKEVDKWLKRTGLKSSGNLSCGKYSGGMKRRLSTAMALIGDPPVILLDEPTSGVDPVARRRFWKIIGKLKNAGQAIMLTSHSMEECEALCDRLGIMVNGEMQCFGGVQHLKNKFAQGYSMTVKLCEDFVNPHPTEPLLNLTTPVTNQTPTPHQSQLGQSIPPGQQQGPNNQIGVDKLSPSLLQVQNSQQNYLGPNQPTSRPVPPSTGQNNKYQRTPPFNSQFQTPSQNQLGALQRQPEIPGQLGAPSQHAPVQGQPVENPEVDLVIQSIIDTFESCVLKDRHTGALKFQIYNVENNPPLTYDVLYAKMEETAKKHEGKIEEYAILECTLEDVFLALAKLQQTYIPPEPSKPFKKLFEKLNFL